MQEVNTQELIKKISKIAENKLLSVYDRKDGLFVAVCVFAGHEHDFSQVWLEVHNSGQKARNSFERILPEKFMTEHKDLNTALTDLLIFLENE